MLTDRAAAAVARRQPRSANWVSLAIGAHAARAAPRLPAACAPRHLCTHRHAQHAPRFPVYIQTRHAHRAGVGLKAAWFGAELLGNVQAALRSASGAAASSSSDSGSSDRGSSSSTSGGGGSGAVGASAAPRSVEECVASIRDDYALDYFISGAAAMDVYADDCRYRWAAGAGAGEG